jgi:hypothetical protein
MVASGNLASNYIPSASLGDFLENLGNLFFFSSTRTLDPAFSLWNECVVSFILDSVAHKAINPLKNQRLALSADLISR